jgi:ectoine hydroxylase-related dioxygenase (phytanoyl-CoA dioxygenase family)
MSERAHAFRRDGYLVVEAACLDQLQALREAADELARRPNSGANYVFGRGSGPVLTKLPQLADRDPTFRSLAQSRGIVDVLEELIGPARLFRDVLITKPAKDGGVVRDHQDIAYWDVSPPEAVVSAWVALDDAPLQSGCLEVVPSSHRSLVEHRLVAGSIPLPGLLTRYLRRTASLAGTGDNPKTLQERAFARTKNFALGTASKFLPFLAELNELHIDPRKIHGRVPLPVRAGDVVFFESRLIHGSGPNTSTNTRRAYIASYMSERCTVPGKKLSDFLVARS